VSGDPYLDDVRRQLGKLKTLAERAMAQIGDEAFFHTLDAEANSVALIVKHLAGNMRSRWTDFLTADGEKPDRGRDEEFERRGSDDRAALMARWEDGWGRLLAAVEPLAAADLGRTVTIRGEPHTVLQAIDRQLVHYAYHVGQIVLLAKHHAGAAWTSLSIPRGRSADFDVSKEGRPYTVGPAAGDPEPR
jgi:hypothetical protein